MHPLKIAVLATVATAVSAENCNPSYNTTSAGECFDNCNSVIVIIIIIIKFNHLKSHFRIDRIKTIESR